MKILILLFFLIFFIEGANAAITYDSGTDIITIVGFTEALPCTFTDIYDADVAGGWGQVSRQGGDQFCFDAAVTIGDGSTSTWFNDIQKAIIIKYDWTVKANAIVWFGMLENATYKQTSKGVNFFSNNTLDSVFEFKNDGGTLHFYSCSFSELQTDGSFGIIIGANNIYNCILHHSWVLETCNGDIYRTTIQKGGTGINSCSAAFEDILITDMSNYGIIVNNALPAETTMKNVKIRNVLYAVRLYGFGVSVSQALYLVNPDFDLWTFSYYYATGGTVYRQYELDLKVIDKDNTPIQTATVKIWDKDSNLIINTTTDVNGNIATQIISRGYYNQANGNTLQDASPHLIKIEKAGYTIYETNFTLEEKTNWLIALQTGDISNGGNGGIISGTVYSSPDYEDVSLLLYIFIVPVLYLFIVIKKNISMISLSMFLLIYIFIYLLHQTISISVNYIYILGFIF